MQCLRKLLCCVKTEDEAKPLVARVISAPMYGAAYAQWQMWESQGKHTISQDNTDDVPLANSPDSAGAISRGSLARTPGSAKTLMGDHGDSDGSTHTIVYTKR